VEQDARTTKEGAGVTRGQNVLYVLPHDEAAIAQFLAPLLERLDPAASETQLLAVTADAESAAWLAAAAVRLSGERELAVVPATTARRAERLLRARTPQVVSGSPRELLALVKATALKLEQVRVLVIAWADQLVHVGDAESLDTLLADLPKTAARVIVTGAIDSGVEALVERYARRARRVGVESADEPTPRAIGYATVSEASRGTALRRLLDEIDPASGTVYVRGSESARVAGDVLRGLGYGGAEASVRLRRPDDDAVREAEVVILYDVPATRAELEQAVVGARRIVALAQPRQLGVLRALSQGGAVTPITFGDAATRARSRERDLREELRRALVQGGTTRELLALEPLLDEWDGVEIAAAALRLLEQARAAIPTGPIGATTAMARLFINVGDRDGARAGDFVGLLTNEGGLTGAQVGRVEIRDTHTLVEVDAGAAETVAEKIAQKELRGRRVQARVDAAADRAERPARPRREPSERPRRSFGEREERSERPRRSFGERDDRGERPRRSVADRDDRGERPARPPRGGFGGARGERGERGAGFRERPSFDRGDRDERAPRGPRGDRPSRGPARPSRPRRYEE